MLLQKSALVSCGTAFRQRESDWQSMTATSTPIEAHVDRWHCDVCWCLEMTGERPPQQNKRWFECLRWVCGVHYQGGSAPRVTVDGEKPSVKFTVWGGGGAPCTLLVFRDTHHPKSIIKWCGLLVEKQRQKERMRGRNQGFKEGKCEEKRRGESALDSIHCLDVNWSWSGFCQHRKQQVQSA